MVTKVIKKPPRTHHLLSFKSKYEKYLSILAILILFTLTARVIYLNIFNVKNYFNFDLINELLYMKKVWETKSLIPNN
jgi:hypothetical protein